MVTKIDMVFPSWEVGCIVEKTALETKKQKCSDKCDQCSEGKEQGSVRGSEIPLSQVGPPIGAIGVIWQYYGRGLKKIH